MMTVYTCVNVPYGAMLGVMTDDTNEKTVFSSFRMFFAYGGSFIALFIWEPLTNALGGYMSTGGCLFRDVHRQLHPDKGASERCLDGECG